MMPSKLKIGDEKGSVLFLEEVASFSGDTGVFEFDHNLQSLIQAHDFNGVQAIVFGRFETSFKMTLEKLHNIIFKSLRP